MKPKEWRCQNCGGAGLETYDSETEDGKVCQECKGQGYFTEAQLCGGVS